MGGDGSHQKQYLELLQTLRSTAEGLLINQVSNVWNIYGGLNRLHHVMERIFKHGCRIFNQEGDPDCWIFIQGLSWLKPSLAASPTFSTEVENNLHQLNPQLNEKALLWIYRSLESHTLSQKLSWLLSDREHLLSCFEETAFLCQEKYGEATLICLRAVEQNQPSLLAEIDPCLYLSTWTYTEFQKRHRRCSSFPETKYKNWQFGQRFLLGFSKQSSEDHCLIFSHTPPATQKQSPDNTSIDMDSVCDYDRLNSCEEATECTGTSSVNDTRVCKEESASDKMCRKVDRVDKLKRWKSLPDTINNSYTNTISESNKPLFGSYTVLHGGFGIQTLPSSPVQCVHVRSEVSSDSQILLDSGISQTIEATISSKLSPSVLLVDYSSETTNELENVPKLTKGNLKQISVKQPVMFSSLKQTRNHQSSIKKSRTTMFKNNLAVDNGVVQSSSSSSSDTLDVNKISTDNMKIIQKSVNMVTNNHNLRPSELNLPRRPWDAENCLDSSSSHTHRAHHPQKLHNTTITGSAPEHPYEWLDDRHHYKKSFIEDGGSSVLPMSIGFFPRPHEGQSLTSFLSSGQFSRPSAELDRENAHFSISEAMIAAIEQVKCNRQLHVADEHGVEESDDEINQLKQRIRIRRRQRQEEKQSHLWGATLLSDGKTDTTTTDQSASPLSTSPGTPSDSISTDDVDDLEVDEVKNLTELRNAGLSVSMASLYSEADLSKHQLQRPGTDVPLTESIVSAEGVALSLIRQFSEKQLPRASDLEWLVSEQDAPQQLLPLPTSWPISPDEAEDTDMHLATPLRGTVEWAPPRPQVIFTPHPPPVRRVLMVKQNYRCAGCGMKVAQEYANRFRYCEYLGRYFCTGCHTGQLALIPGRILAKWDFTRCPVSNFSYRLLDQMMIDPLFVVTDLNPGLYRKAKQLEKSHQLRLQLFYLKDFVLLCRFAELLQEEIRKEPEYIYTDIDTYSVQDFVDVKSGCLPARLSELVNRSILHVENCELCQARGFVCELCHSAHDTIFPWQFNKVSRCNKCGACYHIACRSPEPCPRCERIYARRKNSEEMTVPVDPHTSLVVT